MISTLQARALWSRFGFYPPRGGASCRHILAILALLGAGLYAGYRWYARTADRDRPRDQAL